MGHVLVTKEGYEIEIEIEAESRSWDDLAIVVRRAQRGDRDAFGALVEQFQPTVYAIGLRRLGNASDALELTQEVFLHVLKRIGQLREPERFAGWLRQVATRMAINRATRRVAPPCVEAGVLEGASAQFDEPLDQLISRERADRLWKALGASSRSTARPSMRSTSAATRCSRLPRCSTFLWERSSAGCTRLESGCGSHWKTR